MAIADAASWETLAAVALVVAAAGVGVPILPEGDLADSPAATTIDSCTVVTEPGRYRLAGDVGGNESTCIEIRSSDVVLDGRGHAVRGDGSFGSAGVVVRSPSDRPISNVTVRNVTVAAWDDGVRFIGVDDGSIVGITATENRVGISLLDADGNRIADSTARSNRLRGISLLEDAANNTIANTSASGNDLFGIHLVGAGVRDNVLTGNDASENEFGIVLIGARDNALVANRASSNRIAGVWLSAATGNRLAANVVENRFYGVYLSDRSNRNRVVNNSASGNPVGIRLRSSDRNAVRGNEITGSDDAAVLLISSDRNVVVGNVGSENVRGVTLIRSANNTVRSNDLVD